MPLDVKSSMLSGPPDAATQTSSTPGQTPASSGLFEMFLGEMTGQPAPKNYAKPGDTSNSENGADDRGRPQTDETSADGAAVVASAQPATTAAQQAAPLTSQPNTNSIAGLAMDTGRETASITTQASTAGELLPKKTTKSADSQPATTPAKGNDPAPSALAAAALVVVPTVVPQDAPARLTSVAQTVITRSTDASTSASTDSVSATAGVVNRGANVQAAEPDYTTTTASTAQASTSTSASVPVTTLGFTASELTGAAEQWTATALGSQTPTAASPVTAATTATSTVTAATTATSTVTAASTATKVSTDAAATTSTTPARFTVDEDSLHANEGVSYSDSPFPGGERGGGRGVGSAATVPASMPIHTELGPASITVENVDTSTHAAVTVSAGSAISASSLSTSASTAPVAVQEATAQAAAQSAPQAAATTTSTLPAALTRGPIVSTVSTARATSVYATYTAGPLYARQALASTDPKTASTSESTTAKVSIPTVDTAKTEAAPPVPARADLAEAVPVSVEDAQNAVDTVSATAATASTASQALSTASTLPLNGYVAAELSTMSGAASTGQGSGLPSLQGGGGGRFGFSSPVSSTGSTRGNSALKSGLEPANNNSTGQSLQGMGAKPDVASVAQSATSTNGVGSVAQSAAHPTANVVQSATTSPTVAASATQSASSPAAATVKSASAATAVSASAGPEERAKKTDITTDAAIAGEVGKTDVTGTTSSQAAQPASTPAAADRAEVVRQVAAQVSAAPLKAGNNQVTVKLNPDDWGSVNVRITMTPASQTGGAAQVTAHLTAESPAVKSAIESNMGDLRTALEGAGLHLQSATVSVQAASSAAQSGSAGSGAGFGSHNHPGSWENGGSQASAGSQQGQGHGSFASSSGGGQGNGGNRPQSTHIAAVDEIETPVPASTAPARSSGRLDTLA